MPERTFNEEEHAAIVRAEIERATADKASKIEELTRQLAEANTALDTKAAEVATLTSERDKAAKDLDDHKTEVTEREAATARRGDRLAKVKEVAGHLGDDYFTDERADRWAAMSDADFDAWTTEIAAVAGAKPAEGDNKPPAETAMRGTPADTQRPAGQGGDDKRSATSKWLGGLTG